MATTWILVSALLAIVIGISGSLFRNWAKKKRLKKRRALLRELGLLNAQAKKLGVTQEHLNIQKLIAEKIQQLIELTTDPSELRKLSVALSSTNDTIKTIELGLALPAKSSD
jgi:hypothetical protein